jgi:DNA-binding XRE family transcriptional regulator
MLFEKTSGAEQNDEVCATGREVVWWPAPRGATSQKGVTQASLAGIAGMSEAYISNMEHGFKVPSLTTIIRLAVALDCKVMDLVGAFDNADLRTLLPK